MISDFNYQLVATEDGSLSIRDSETGELYHNRAGAYSEALVNYVQPSGAVQRMISNGHLSVFDACFGLGYNSLVLMEELLKNEIGGKLDIFGIDMNSNLLLLIPKVLQGHKFSHLNNQLDVSELFNTGFTRFCQPQLEICLRFQTGSLRNPKLYSDVAVDYIFHDPFSPRRMPELWTVDIFRHYFEMLNNSNGALLTYSLAHAVRGGLSEAGFKIGRTEGLGDKKGGTIAICADNAEHFVFSELSGQERSRLNGRSGVPYRDSTFNSSRLAILERRRLEQSERPPGD